MGVLDGLSVVELSIAIAAPSCCRALAFHGADVVKMESRTNPDVARLFGSAWAAGIESGPYMDSSPYLAEMSANKRSIGLELKQPAAHEVALELLRRADVFVTNYSTPAVTGLGLSYEAVAAINPRLIYVALPGFGSDPAQPYYEFLAWGPNQAPLVGLDELTGYPDQVPAGIATTSPPDYFAGLHAIAAVLTALEHRDQTGEGSFVDIAQFETTVSSLGPFLLDHALSGEVPERSGNRLAWLAPQGCYPGTGEDEWVAITVDDDAGWARLATVLGDGDGHPGGPPTTNGNGTSSDSGADGGASDARFATLGGRLRHHDEIDALIETWTSTRTATEAAELLQKAGVAAHEVLDNRGMLRDPQVRDRQWFQFVESKRFPDGDAFSGHPIRLGRDAGSWWRAGPSMGQDTVAVLADRVGMAADAINALLAAGDAFADASPELKLRRPYVDDPEARMALGAPASTSPSPSTSTDPSTAAAGLQANGAATNGGAA